MERNFLSEAGIMQQLDHPNVIRFHHVSSDFGHIEIATVDVQMQRKTILGHGTRARRQTRGDC